MTVADGALRDGVLYDLLGRVQHRDMRDVTVDQFMRRYHVDRRRRSAWARCAESLLRGIEDKKDELAPDRRLPRLGRAAARDRHLDRAGRVPQALGLHPAERRHAGLLSRRSRATSRTWCSRSAASSPRWVRRSTTIRASPSLAFCLRLAVIVYRSRRTLKLPKLRVSRNGEGFKLEIESRWLADHSLVAIALEAEREQWVSVGRTFEVAET